MRVRRSIVILAVVAVLAGGAYALFVHLRAFTLGDALRVYGAAARVRLGPYFKRASIAYPPKRVALLAFKKERRIAVWVSDGAQWRFLRAYPILAASGVAGPKLRQGDYQVPEGRYRIEYLNPQSSYHLSMKVGYPNAFDRQHASADGRTNLGGDIFMHGKNVSIGCIAVGDIAIEELFTLVADTGLSRVEVLIAPNDLRIAPPPPSTISWVPALYRTLGALLAHYPVELESGAALDIRGMRKEAKVLPAR